MERLRGAAIVTPVILRVGGFPRLRGGTYTRTLSAPVFRWFAFATFLSMILIVLSGAAVRLTGSAWVARTGPRVFTDESRAR